LECESSRFSYMLFCLRVGGVLGMYLWQGEVGAVRRIREGRGP